MTMEKRGFTLIELVIVVTILAIVAAVSIPAFQNLKQRAKISACRGILGAIRSGISLYRANEIAQGRSDGVISQALLLPGGNPGNQVKENPLDSNSGSVVTLNGDIPDNPFANDVGGFVAGDEDHIDAGASYSCCNPTGSNTEGWRYNTTTGRFWANTNVAGENAF